MRPLTHLCCCSAPLLPPPLPHTPPDASDYDKIAPTDRISILGLQEFAPGKGLTLQGKRTDGSTYTIPVNHTFNENQVGGWVL